VKPAVEADQPSQAEPEDNRKKILNLVNQLDDQELAKVSELLSNQQNANDQQQPEDNTQAETLDDELIPPSQVSGLTHKSMISNLQKQLQEERDARARLEGELMTLKEISQDIAVKLDTQGKKRYH